MIAKENILAKAEAENWEAAIRIVGGLLEKAGSVTPKYTQSMIDAVKEMGPYMVILPNFALAHAAPSEAVLKDDTALITLKKPVDFGSQNDPVYVVLAICSQDGKSHMASLTKIAEMLMKENTLDELKQAASVEEILAIINKDSTK